ncbi:MAG: amidohydrolase, partial [Prevotella sp.]|nr:amidohydrolase [Prevotella sp.]
IKTMEQNASRSMFLGNEVQMLPPFMIDGKNTAEVFLSNMDYAQVSAAVVTQEFIDGIQNDYLEKVQRTYPNRFFVCGMCNHFQPGFADEAKTLIDCGFRAIKIPAHRLLLSDRRILMTSPEMMQMFHLMEDKGIIFSVDLADGDMQVGEMKEIIAECPQLKIAIGHFGMPTTDRWEEQIKLARHEHVFIESGGITWLFNSEFYPFKGAIRAIREAADLAGIEKLMWGSDYPRTITAITYKMSYDFVLKSTELTDYEKECFLGENAHKFYGFNDLVELPYIKNMSE